MTRFSAVLPDFSATVRALAETIAAREEGAPGSAQAASAFILASYAAMPSYLRPPLRAATLFFDVWPLPRRGRVFHRLSPTLRRAQLEAWETSPLGAARMLITFYVSLTVFRLWPEQASLG